jgi:hypothetical protein
MVKLIASERMLKLWKSRRSRAAFLGVSASQNFLTSVGLRNWVEVYEASKLGKWPVLSQGCRVRAINSATGAWTLIPLRVQNKNYRAKRRDNRLRRNKFPGSGN